MESNYKSYEIHSLPDRKPTNGLWAMGLFDNPLRSYKKRPVPIHSKHISINQQYN